MMDEEETKPLRYLLRQFLSPEECKELEFIHKSNSTIGYRSNVFSTTLSHLIATHSPHFLLPFVPIRERLKDKVEELFGCQFQLCIEFTGLISYGKDFKGGLFHFQDGEPTTVVPMAGDVSIYTADDRNIHSVDEIIEGERLTLALWFTRNGDHDEDAKIISLLSNDMFHSSINVPKPFPGSDNMYWFSGDAMSDQKSGFDIRWARIIMLGFDIYSSQEKSSSLDLMEPLQLARESELYELKFVNSLHALQVVQFYCWKASELLNSKYDVETSKVVHLSQSQLLRIDSLKSLMMENKELAEMVLSCSSCAENGQNIFDWISFSTSIAAFEAYIGNLYKELQMSLPDWRKHGIVHSVSFE
ncbi:hypothetical protein Tsubulata_022366 [Turnera subulata]|uniref:Prolyl 4-hydroxylase alpha subunit Fe(2+) 2OG dioxygenase domain-containing protein n=1 Tax=Turnera subulata TaxID=218843 RepID=A0A9Q0J2F6_9ROSI|nr:hypothetical protein Tsubulata_022366 [Turnera subulata]